MKNPTRISASSLLTLALFTMLFTMLFTLVACDLKDVEQASGKYLLVKDQGGGVSGSCPKGLTLLILPQKNEVDVRYSDVDSAFAITNINQDADEGAAHWDGAIATRYSTRVIFDGQKIERQRRDVSKFQDFWVTHDSGWIPDGTLYPEIFMASDSKNPVIVNGFGTCEYKKTMGDLPPLPPRPVPVPESATANGAIDTACRESTGADSGTLEGWESTLFVVCLRSGLSDYYEGHQSLKSVVTRICHSLDDQAGLEDKCLKDSLAGIKD